jgi:hypothetical protein
MIIPSTPTHAKARPSTPKNAQARISQPKVAQCNEIKLPNRPQLPEPPNQLTNHNIKVSPFVKMGKNQQNHHHHDDYISLFF